LNLLEEKKQEEVNNTYPLCYTCGQFIVKNEVLIQQCERNYHEQHFTCNSCLKPLYNVEHFEYLLEPYCKYCYDHISNQIICQICSNIITKQEESIIIENYQLHISCFKCSKCKKLLSEQEFAFVNEVLYCNDHNNNDHNN